MSPAAPLTPAQLMMEPENTRVIRRTLHENSTSKRDLDDATQDVCVKLLEAFARGDAPADLGEMMAFSTTVAKRHAIDVLRKKEADARDLAEPCDASEYYPLRPLHEQRDPVEAGRQLEVLAQLFRDDRMPEHGVDILEGVASGCSYAEIGEPLKLSAASVRARLRQMRKVYRRRMVKLVLWPDMPPLRVVASSPNKSRPRFRDSTILTNESFGSRGDAFTLPAPARRHPGAAGGESRGVFRYLHAASRKRHAAD